MTTANNNQNNALKEEKAAPKKAGSRQRKSKEQIRKERTLNATMVPLSGKSRSELGIVSVQPEKDVFMLSSGVFAKVYMLKGVELTGNRKRILISTLCARSKNRMRLSTFSYANSTTPIISLTVYFHGNQYSKVVDEIDAFDEMLEGLMEDKFSIKFVSCSIGDCFMFIYMNYSGQMRKTTTNMIIKKSANLKKSFFKKIKENETGYIVEGTGREGCTYICTEFPDSLSDFMGNLKNMKFTYLSCIDFQSLSEDYNASYMKALDRFYNLSVESEEDTEDDEHRKLDLELFGVTDKINLTFIIDFIFESGDEKRKYENAIKQLFFENGMVMSPGIGVQEKIADSISSLGIIDFHCNRNVDFDIASNLF